MSREMVDLETQARRMIRDIIDESDPQAREMLVGRHHELRLRIDRLRQQRYAPA